MDWDFEDALWEQEPRPKPEIDRAEAVKKAVVVSQDDPSTWPFRERPGGPEWTARFWRKREENIRRRSVFNAARRAAGEPELTAQEWMAIPGQRVRPDEDV